MPAQGGGALKQREREALQAFTKDRLIGHIAKVERQRDEEQQSRLTWEGHFRDEFQTALKLRQELKPWQELGLTVAEIHAMEDELRMARIKLEQFREAPPSGAPETAKCADCCGDPKCEDHECRSHRAKKHGAAAKPEAREGSTPSPAPAPPPPPAPPPNSGPARAEPPGAPPGPAAAPRALEPDEMRRVEDWLAGSLHDRWDGRVLPCQRVLEQNHEPHRWDDPEPPRAHEGEVPYLCPGRPHPTSQLGLERRTRGPGKALKEAVGRAEPQDRLSFGPPEIAQPQQQDEPWGPDQAIRELHARLQALETVVLGEVNWRADPAKTNLPGGLRQAVAGLQTWVENQKRRMRPPAEQHDDYPHGGG